MPNDLPNVLKVIDKKQEIKFKNVIRIYKTGFFIFAISFLGLYIMNVPKYAIDDFLNEHIEAIYGIIIMPGKSSWTIWTIHNTSLFEHNCWIT
ncbi:MAG: hypothetical protein V8R82_00335 [Clostridia bacterium]